MNKIHQFLKYFLRKIWIKMPSSIKSFAVKLSIIFTSNVSLRLQFFSWIAGKISYLPYQWRLALQAVPRPYYGYPILYSMNLAKSLGGGLPEG